MQNPNQVRLDHVNLSVRNFEEALEWYRSLFDFQLVESGRGPGGQPWGIVRNGDAMLCLHQDAALTVIHADDPAPLDHRVDHFALRLTDEARFTRLIEQRAERTYYGSPVRYPHSNSYYVADPSGHSIEVVFWRNDTVQFA